MEPPIQALPRWLNPKRFRKSKESRTLLQEAASDRGRVLFCASFRRLNQKMQVFALDPNDAVRTRLTHSLEVAHLGMIIVDDVFRLIDVRKAKASSAPHMSAWVALSPEQRLAIRTIVETACLVHDIGNPPFGHFGEKAIRSWFEPYTPELQSQFGATNKDFVKDFINFDGNKQGFRILTKLQRNMSDNYGLNLTYSQLAATIKYPIDRPDRKGSVFESEKDLKVRVWEELGLESTEKHPLVLLMEAADDIAYCVSDIEDAHEKRLLSDEDLVKVFGLQKKRQDMTKALTEGKTRVTRELVTKAAAAFLARLKADHWNNDSLPSKGSTLSNLRLLANKRIYSARVVLANEITAFKVITGILDAFKSLLFAMSPGDFGALAERFSNQQSIYADDETEPIVKGLTEHPGLLALFPRKHLSAYLAACDAQPANELFHRAHLIVDFVAGMTDDFALNIYRLLSGQRTYEATR